MSDPLHMSGVVLAEKFRVERLLGEGGHGVVYAGTHLLLNAPIAVKFLKVESAGAEQFLREARILFSLSHPAIVRMYDVGEVARTPGHGAAAGARMPWVVLELLSGPTLEAELDVRRAQRRHFTAAELRAIFIPVLDGLAFAHARGVMHRDIKPANILLSRPSPGREEPKILDFGTARSQASAFQAAAGNTGFTPLYAAPEQWDSSIAQPSPATDVYSVALTMLECATLERAFGDADGVGALMRAVMSGAGRPPLRSRRPDLPPALHEVLDRAMGVYPTARFRDAGELRVAVEQALLTATTPNGTALLAGSGPLFGPSAAPQGYGPSAPPAYGPSAPPAYGPSGAPTNPQNTSSPFVQTQPKVTRASSAGVVAMVIAIVGGILLVIGVIAVVGLAALVNAFAGDDDDAKAKAVVPPQTTITVPPTSTPPKEDPTTPSTSDAGAKGARLSKGIVEVDGQFDMADAAKVTQSHYPDIERCFEGSQKWTGELVISLKVRTRDGRVVGSTCKTNWREDNREKAKTLPKLDPRASEFCGCVQTQTPAWGFKKPKDDVASQWDPDDANDLDVTYVAE